MENLIKQFEKESGISATIESELYADGEIYAKEYTEWLEKRIQALSMSGVSHRFSDVDIEDEANERMFVADDDLTQSEIYREGFVEGAIWIRDALK